MTGLDAYWKFFCSGLNRYVFVGVPDRICGHWFIYKNYGANNHFCVSYTLFVVFVSTCFYLRKRYGFAGDTKRVFSSFTVLSWESMSFKLFHFSHFTIYIFLSNILKFLFGPMK